ncbi:hypothetical protein SLEP1_g3057 [Rubroshorea leprosula]|uniref:Uncharacterized protein n=1 Tax=Rubroshorea leprosula TaxID=152421 RepID=A0AAV5HV01_9ROSI|nr:hypothetical protein SLEP1_g3057 [Rubroshorea leprosula]
MYSRRSRSRSTPPLACPSLLHTKIGEPIIDHLL